MSREPKWKTEAVALEYWAVTAFIAGAFVVGLLSAIRDVLRL